MSSIHSPVEAPQDRRTFLKRGLLGGALLLAGSGTLLALRKGKSEPAAPGKLASFDPAIFPVVMAVVSRMVPAADPLAVALAMDEALTYTPPAIRADINKVFGLLENSLAGVLTRGSMTPFTLLTPDGQDRALGAWRDSRIAVLTGAYHGIRKLSLSAYYSDLKTALQIGYPGPFFDKPDAGPLQARGPLSKPFVVTPPAANAAKENSK